MPGDLGHAQNYILVLICAVLNVTIVLFCVHILYIFEMRKVTYLCYFTQSYTFVLFRAMPEMTKPAAIYTCKELYKCMREMTIF